MRQLLHMLTRPKNRMNRLGLPTGAILLRVSAAAEKCRRRRYRRRLLLRSSELLNCVQVSKEGVSLAISPAVRVFTQLTCYIYRNPSARLIGLVQ